MRYLSFILLLKKKRNRIHFIKDLNGSFYFDSIKLDYSIEYQFQNLDDAELNRTIFEKHVLQDGEQKNTSCAYSRKNIQRPCVYSYRRHSWQSAPCARIHQKSLSRGTQRNRHKQAERDRKPAITNNNQGCVKESWKFLRQLAS